MNQRRDGSFRYSMFVFLTLLLQNFTCDSHRILLSNLIDEECSILGSRAAEKAAEHACFQVKLRCLPSESAIDLDPPNLEIPFMELSSKCFRIAETFCRTGSRPFVSSKSDPVCSDLLTFGPVDALTECAFLSDAINEFNWSIHEFCSLDLFSYTPTIED